MSMQRNATFNCSEPPASRAAAPQAVLDASVGCRLRNRVLCPPVPRSGLGLCETVNIIWCIGDVAITAASARHP